MLVGCPYRRHRGGGFTPSRKIMAACGGQQSDVEIQCWGYTLTQAANLHLMLAYNNCIV